MDIDESQQHLRGKTDQILRENFLKVAQTILQARIPSLSAPSSSNKSTPPKSNKWVILAFYFIDLELLSILAKDIAPLEGIFPTTLQSFAES